MSKLKVVIIGGGGNTAEVTGSILTLNGHNVSFFRFPKQVKVKGTPVRPTRSLERLQKFQVNPREGLEDYSYQGKAYFTDINGISKADVIIIAMPSYMMELLPKLLPNVFSNKIVISLCERFLNTSVFLRAIKETGFLPPKFMISHRSDPFDANKVGKDGFNRLWRMKENNDYFITPNIYLKEAVDIMVSIYGTHAYKWKSVSSIWDIAFQNLNAISHAVTDFDAVFERKFILGQPHYTKDTYTPLTVENINRIIAERDILTQKILGKVFPSLRAHEKSSYGSKGMEDILGTAIFRLENKILVNRPAPEMYRASGFEDIGWSLVPMEEVATMFKVPMPYTSNLINKWSQKVGVNYRKVGRKVGDLIQTLPNCSVLINSYSL